MNILIGTAIGLGVFLLAGIIARYIQMRGDSDGK